MSHETKETKADPGPMEAVVRAPTPGPWCVDPTDPQKVITGNGALVSRVIAAADAPLVAAALELRLTLRTLTALVENMRVPQNLTEAGLQIMQFAPAIERARTLLDTVCE